ncbi:hypothetical protein Tco_0905902, partial [Tanacetum coccineum]
CLWDLFCPEGLCPSLSFLPSNGKVEAVMGFKYKCFLDAYKGYHHIQMAREDEEKTAFYTEQGTYCYMKMPFNFVRKPEVERHLKSGHSSTDESPAICRAPGEFDETFSEAWDRFKDLLRKCPHHGFSELHQIDTFYNALTQSDQDSLNAAAGGNLLNRTPRDSLTIIENKSKVRISRNKPIVSKVSTTTSSPSPSLDVITLTEIVKELVLMNKATQQATVKAIEETCVTCGGPHPYYECLAADGNIFNAFAATGTYN